MAILPTVSPLSIDEHPSLPTREEATITLVLGLRSKAPQAAEELHRLYREALLRFCWGYLGGMEEAEDAVQDIVCKVLEAADVPPPDRFRPWLYKIARHHCLNLLRDRAMRKDGQNIPAASQMFVAMTGNLTRMVRDELRSKLAEMVHTLPEFLQEILRLRYVEDLSRAEIAEVLDIPESAVKSRIFEGLKKLRDLAEQLEQT